MTDITLGSLADAKAPPRRVPPAFIDAGADHGVATTSRFGRRVVIAPVSSLRAATSWGGGMAFEPDSDQLHNAGDRSVDVRGSRTRLR